MTTTERSDDDFADAIVRTLDDDALPDGVAERLVQARRRAIAEPSSGADAMARRSFALAAGIGALALTISFVALRAPVDDAPLASTATGVEPALAALVDIAEPALAEDIDLLEDLEFLAWLEQEALLDAS